MSNYLIKVIKINQISFGYFFEFYPEKRQKKVSECKTISYKVPKHTNYV